MNTKIELFRGDITQQNVDAIVNAANSALSGGGGVDGAIHRAGGPTIMQECRTFQGGCPTGSAVATTAGALPCKRVLHAVGPVWDGGAKNEDQLLASAYRSCLELAQKEGLRSLAFPSLSTGAYRFPIERASEIARKTVRDFCTDAPQALDLVRFVVFSESDEAVYRRKLA